MPTWERGAPPIHTSTRWILTSFSTAGTHSIDVAGPIPASVAVVQDRHRLRAVLAGAHERPLVLRQRTRRRPRTSRPRLRRRRRILNDQNAMTYLTPHANQTGHFTGDLTPLGVRIDASGGWWDAGDYLKFVQTSSYTEDLLLAGVRDMPGQMGAGSRPRTPRLRRSSASEWLLKMWTTRPERSITRWGSGPGTRRRAVTTTSGDCRKPTIPYGGTDPSTGTSGTGPSSAPALLDRS